ncbi:hypothetical protein RSJ21_04635 [Clostridium botulinum]|uniref:hypothetical protein n=1 Tax=Clostridium botulinum TaxID=1491 RepID=UPI00094747C9|nr:hypothetical protein [Clostridium botulinum]APQ74421.1 putative membrane protein [Clostridium botulinum]AUN09735.1 hypothetical protein RSJ6_04190 [Clostridium botulinum]AUN20779.1 hypothetical protein RSJ22_04770 [Clostridium botulinum]AUN24563.1 hypothetical protein RSJ21_04635 [Clostridium botulinum]OSA72888.1 hypothetical protein B2H87_01860 [Clostridium botulinum]
MINNIMKNNKLVDMLEEESYIENDERIHKIYNEIDKEKYTIIFLALLTFYLYELMILQKNDTPLVFVIIFDGIYTDIKLAMSEAYIKTNLKYMETCGALLLLLRYFKYKFLININFIMLIIISCVVGYLYIKLMLYINNRSKI